MIGWLLAIVVLVPNTTITPGIVRPLTRTQVCAIRWGRDVRHVTVAMKRQVAARYGVAYPVPYRVEWDHLIPRELGGADDARNLWPEPWTEARHVKDPLENALHRAVCARRMTLVAAQAVMRRWPLEVIR